MDGSALGFWIVIPMGKSSILSLGVFGSWFFGYEGGFCMSWLTDVVLIADSVRACGKAFAEVKRMRTMGMNGNAKKGL